MERQLDPLGRGSAEGSRWRGAACKFRMPAKTIAITGDRSASAGVQFDDGRELEADLVVMAAGIRPEHRPRPRGRPALRARRAGQRHAADLRSLHLRRGRMRPAPQQHLRPGRAAVRAGEGLRHASRGGRSSAATAARCCRPSSRSPASICSPPAISSAGRPAKRWCCKDAEARHLQARRHRGQQGARRRAVRRHAGRRPGTCELMYAGSRCRRAARQAAVRLDAGGMTEHASVSTTCPYCGVGCGVLARTRDRRERPRSRSAATPTHPANFGKLCSKGSALGETLGLGGPAALSRTSTASARAGMQRSTMSPQGFRRIIDRARTAAQSRCMSPASC